MRGFEHLASPITDARLVVAHDLVSEDPGRRRRHSRLRAPPVRPFSVIRQFRMVGDELEQ